MTYDLKSSKSEPRPFPELASAIRKYRSANLFVCAAATAARSATN